MSPKSGSNKTSTSTKRTMSDDHKAAIAEGRVQSRAVKNYLDAVVANKPKRGRRRTPDSIQARVDAIDASIDGADPITALKLRQEKKDLTAELASSGSKVDLSALEDDFVAQAKAYGARNGISYGVWREAGVAPGVLKKAGITRGM